MQEEEQVAEKQQQQQEQQEGEKEEVSPTPGEPVASSGGLRGSKTPAARSQEEGDRSEEAAASKSPEAGGRLRGAKAAAAAGAADAAWDALTEGVEGAAATAAMAQQRLRGQKGVGAAATPEDMAPSAAVEQPGHGCTGGMVWSECARPCDATCLTPQPICAALCVARCHCPASAPIWNGNRCITELDCPAAEAAAAPAARPSSSSLRGAR